MQKIDYHVMKRPLTGVDDECGDTGVVREYDGHCFMALVDVLGHGKEAFEVAVLVEDYLSIRYDQDLVELIQGLHTHLTGTRGAVAAVCRLELCTGVLDYSGMGNICMRIFGSSHKRLITRDGILGYGISSPKQKRFQLYPGDIFIMSSDGIREHVDLVDYPEILMGSAETITIGFIENLGKKNDDASCVALRYGI